MYYGNKSIEEIDNYYNINTDVSPFPYWKLKDCAKIQKGFKKNNIDLTLAECKILYEIYSDESYCSGWDGGIDGRTEDSLFDLLLPWLNKILADRAKRILVITEQLEKEGYKQEQ